MATLTESSGITDAEALAVAVTLAEHCQTLAATGKAVNDALDVDWSEAKWRGLWKHNPREAEMVRKRLNTARHRIEQTIRITGDTRGAVASDFHAPYHDYLAVLLLCKVLAWWNPDLFVIDGDALDFYPVSTYDKNPERAFGLQTEIDEFHTDILAPITAAIPKARKIFMPGNHEARLRKFLWRNPDLYGVRSLQLPSLLGLGVKSKVFVIFWTAWPAILLNTAHGLNRVDADVCNAARIDGAGRWSLFRYIELPLALPMVMTGFRIGLSGGFISLVSAEMLGGSAGLGYSILAYSQTFRFPQMYAVIIIIAAIGLAMNTFLSLIQSLSDWEETHDLESPFARFGDRAVAWSFAVGVRRNSGG